MRVRLHLHVDVGHADSNTRKGQHKVLLSFLCPISIMLVQALLQTSLVLWLAQQTLQGGVGIGVKPGVAGALGALGSRYGTKAMKTGIGRYPGAQLGIGGHRALGLGGRAGLRQGGYGGQGAYGAALGTGMLGTGLTNGLGLGQGGKHGYGVGLGTLPGYGALAGIGYPGARPGYMGGAGNYLGASLGAGAYGAGLGQGGYLGGVAGKLGAAAALGQGGYPLGVAGKLPGYGEGATGYLGAMAGNGFGYGNGYSDGHGAALSTGGYAGQVQGAYGALGAGLDSTGGKYGGGGAAQVPYGNAPVIPTGLEGDGRYPYPAQQLNLGAEGAKTANKYGAGTGYGAQQTGYGAQLGATQDALGEQAGKYGGVNGALGNGYKG
ncbi:hypothetical protein FQN60_004140 [Etheostoma spectabile]|uniref:Uncharacterized protein n=1 Tax=Etheostoma spectabile TaxID=54343 RepID=A0A5J5CXP3_9PERO|nr:hypothetical protein FQN60_004140 [Etheostoma spectabile]